MSAGTPGTPQPPPPPDAAAPAAAKSSGSRAILYVVAGCGGCLFLGAATAAVLLLVASHRMKHRIEAARTEGIVFEVREQSVSLHDFLVEDPASDKRVGDAWADLKTAAQAGKLTLEDVRELQESIDEATADGSVSADEASALAAKAEAIRGASAK